MSIDQITLDILWSRLISTVNEQAAALMRERAGEIAPLLTQEQGKPLAEAKAETLAAADITEWFAEEPAPTVPMPPPPANRLLTPRRSTRGRRSGGAAVPVTARPRSSGSPSDRRSSRSRR